MISKIRFGIDGSNAWLSSGYKIYAQVAGSSSVTLREEGSAAGGELINLDNSKTNTRSFTTTARKITSVGDFTNTINLSLSGADGKYTYVYDGKTVDQYASWPVG